MSAFDLRFVMDHPEGIVLAASGDYVGWTIASTTWTVIEAGDPVTVEGPLDLNAFDSGVSATATAVLTSPDGTQQITLTSMPIYAQDNGSSGRTIYSDTPDGDPIGIIVAGQEASGSMIQQDYIDGKLSQVIATLVDGTETGFEFDAQTGQLARIYEYDGGEVHDWEYKLENYNANGITSSQVVYDNGVETDSGYSNGQIAYSYTQDLQDAFSYTDILKTYTDGQLNKVSTRYDDGVSSLADYENGVIQNTQTLDNDDAHAYLQKYAIYENGVLQQAVTQMDDGRNYIRDYQDGVIQTITGVDIQDAKSWDQQYTFYDNGVVAQRATFYDDGREQITSYNANEEGTGSVINERVTRDLGDAHSWTEQIQNYDENGVIAYDAILFDDGATRYTTYENGVRSLRSTTDNTDSRNYQSITELFDGNGTRRTLEKEMDDGRVIQREYAEDGAFEFQIITDFNDAVSYETQTSVYNDGVIAGRETQFDNGVFRTEAFDETGSRTGDQRLDNGDAYAWHSITRTFEDGQVTSTDIIYDADLIA